MTNLEVLDIIHQALSESHHAWINDVTYDNDNNSGEIVMTTDDAEGKVQIWVISSKDIRETYDEAQVHVVGEADRDKDQPCGDCGETPKDGADRTSVADHGRCIDCHKEWQHSPEPNRGEIWNR